MKKQWYVVSSYNTGNPIVVVSGYKAAKERANTVKPPYDFCKLTDYIASKTIDGWQQYQVIKAQKYAEDKGLTSCRV
jgi:hypothetical protein